MAVEPTPAESSPELLTSQPSDRCANCGSPLAPDQRYCVECGERRGKARFSFESLAVPKADGPAAPKPPPRQRFSSSFSFIAGVATLLLALGVGVLIGHNTNTQKTAAATPNQTIKVEGLGGASNNTASTPASNSFKPTKVPKLSKKVVKKVTQAASSVLGTGTKNLSNNVTQQGGGKCSGGSGCQGGKFTGNFFGGG